MSSTIWGGYPYRVETNIKKDYIFTTYNELNKEFEVHVMLVDQEYQIKLVKRLDGDKPPRLTLEKLAQMMQDGFDKINQRIDKLDQRIDKLENLVVEQFKAHNWIK